MAFEISIATCCFRGLARDEIELTLTEAAGAGAEGIAIGGPIGWTHGLCQWLDAARLRSRARKAGLLITEFYGPVVRLGEPVCVAEDVDHVIMAAQTTSALGAERLVHTGTRRRDVPLEALVKALENAGERLPRDVRVCLEPHADHRIATAEDYDVLMDRLPPDRFGICIDTGHFHVQGVDWKSLIRRYPERVWNVHVKDHAGSAGVALGDGEIDLHSLLELLGACGYRGPLAIELEVDSSRDRREAVKRSVDYLARLRCDILGR